MNLAGRIVVATLVTAGIGLGAWQLMETAPQSKRERPPAPMPLLDVVDSTPSDHAVRLTASGTVISAAELEVRPQVGGRLVGLHPDFEPGGRIPAGEDLFEIEPAEYRLAVASAEAEIAKARAAIALEEGRRVVAREELASLQSSVPMDATSKALALRKPQLRQVQAELAAAENGLKRAQLDLERTRMSLPFDVIVLSRDRVAGEVVAVRELIGQVARADEYWIDLRLSPQHLARVNAQSAERPGSPVVINDGGQSYSGEVLRIRADLAEGSRLGGVIAAIPIGGAEHAAAPLLGRFVEAEIDAGRLQQVIEVPRRALRENNEVWVADDNDTLQVRPARVRWQNGQTLLLDADTLQTGDRIVVSRLSGVVPGSQVRTRVIELMLDPLAVGLVDGASREP